MLLSLSELFFPFSLIFQKGFHWKGLLYYHQIFGGQTQFLVDKLGFNCGPRLGGVRKEEKGDCIDIRMYVDGYIRAIL